MTLPAVGNENPILAINLAGVGDYTTSSQYLDLMQSMRKWVGNSATQWGSISHEAVVESGVLDENGWPTEIPEGMGGIGTIWDWNSSSTEDPQAAQLRAGVYILEYEGEGEIGIWGATILSQEDGKIVFENRSGGTFSVNIRSTDPDGTGDYIRDMTIVAEEHYDLFKAGAIFNPDWIEKIEDMRQLRFMNWQGTNNSTLEEWEDMPSSDSRGVADSMSVEDMVRLANETGTDPWFCMPHAATEEYIREFATYVRDNLDPDLQVRVEYSNEAWNSMFSVNAWLKEQAQENWGMSGEMATDAYYTMMATKSALIWEDVFAQEADARLVNVLSTQAPNLWRTMRILDPVRWAENDPDSYVDPADVFDELAITNYFGSNPLSTTEGRSDVLNLLKTEGLQAAIDYTVALTMDPSNENSIPALAEVWQSQSELAHSLGMDLVAYEGGQHIHAAYNTAGLSTADQDLLQDFLVALVRSPEMAEMYQEVYEIWTELSDGPFMQYTDVDNATIWGSWGLYASLLDENPRAQLLEELNAIAEPWWDANGGEQYMQGVVRIGEDGDDLIAGTVEEDYLTGGAGNDTIIGGEGNDGINGGAGTDRLILAGTLDDYTITVEGEGYMVVGPDGTDYIYDVEELEFSGSGAVMTVQAAVAGGTAVEENTASVVTPAAPAEAAVAAPEPTPEPAPEPVAAIPAQPGVVDLSDLTEGQAISGINKYGLLGKELGLSEENAYFTAARDASADFNGENVSANYYSINQNRAVAGGDLLTGSATETAEILGTVSTDVTKVIGSQGNDHFDGRSAADHFQGGDGADYMDGMGSDDLLEGEGGNDYLRGGKGNDTLEGGSGDDKLYGLEDDDQLTGGAGADHYYFSRGIGHDTITDFAAEDTLHLGTFLTGYSDPITLAETDDGLLLSNGTDSITFAGYGLSDANWIFAGTDVPLPEDDLIVAPDSAVQATPEETGEAGVVDLSDLTEGQAISAINKYGLLGQELGLKQENAFFNADRGVTVNINGQDVGPQYYAINQNRAEAGGAALTGSAKETADLLGNVTTDVTKIIGSQGNDSYNGRSGADHFEGGQGHDYIDGAGGDDVLIGDAGNDWMRGGKGADTLDGGEGHDNLFGLEDNDVLTGGAGMDTFYFSRGIGHDTITDFSAEDSLDLGSFMNGVDNVFDHLSETDDGLVLTNGDSSITFQGLTLADADWIFH
ncbi:hypothetical protein BFP70_05150 [Thioclava sp. SK-1]|uniref:calcium-binding protein n=1 Tax=Thioclava sp. SK-1 TaxID=1889770 RepID=UPI000824A0A3|nr:calcium-binding protein [Thioclava sp. SK-1]OCX66411.1 hypothetical protein BFP70_05150 [Thioclava sp. SK-1]